MEDLSNYSQDEIYEMLKNGYITIDDLDYYIKNGTFKAEDLEIYIRDGLIKINDIIPYIKNGVLGVDEIAKYINDGIIEVSDVAVYIKDGTIDGELLATKVQDTRATETIEAIESSEPSKPMEEQSEQVEKPEEKVEPTEPTVVETPEPTVQPNEAEMHDAPIVEESEPNKSTEDLSGDINKNLNYESPSLTILEQGNEVFNAFKETKNYCDDPINGIKMEGSSIGKDGRGPYISFEINNESKQIIDHLMSSFYQMPGISVEFMRNMQNRKEFFTIQLDPNMSQVDMQLRAKEMFNKIYDTIRTTREDLDYEQTMPEGLKVIKDRFNNDAPDIGDNFIIGYVRNDGKDSYYIVANNNQAAIEYARSIGFEIKNSQGANIYEINATGSMVDTKVAESAVDLSTQNLDVKNFGVSELDVYGKLDTDYEVEKIQNFIETSNDPHLMCILEVEVPSNNPSQRIVKMKREMGGTEVVVFPDGNNFDRQVMPKIIDTYAENNPIYPENISTSGSDALDMASCQVYSENNTTLSINGYSSSETNRLVSDIQARGKASTENEYTNTNNYQKSIGTYPTNDGNKAAFVSMPVLFVICILFILMISLIIFTS